MWLFSGPLIDRCHLSPFLWEWEAGKTGHPPLAWDGLVWLGRSSFGHMETSCPWAVEMRGDESLSQTGTGESIFLSIRVCWSVRQISTGSVVKWEERMWRLLKLQLEKSVHSPVLKPLSGSYSYGYIVSLHVSQTFNTEKPVTTQEKEGAMSDAILPPSSITILFINWDLIP